ncbi:beta-galactosidase [Thermosporothrix hazakensis]|jgi:beta-galactosidase|uniref:Beta-galactosidase n=2 Tax=Thermosporothrix TaxID=768650 RepID=A0A326U9Q1_THEHA|nr:beta-galactosidase family protein [Thermosporothrix hazakensis]PZW29204.1 beta-galactosidase [Thermosporothrix hazakensis]BBH86131.1 beta-galactosidase [Thermosporothrix sp. COM3]GCE45444.1 beta-galactosidase [Thermosporothrix hazakensis]
MGTFTPDKEHFVLDGKPFRVLSGALHYFRVPPEYWDDRLHKLRAMGLNTVETYVAWNLHEPRPGEFDFSGGLDLARFIQKAAEQGLYVLLRPGPYICAEWEFGGLPAWLLKDPGMRLRCYYRPYLEAVDRFFDALLPQVTPLQITHGGPILAMQVENEYGSYGNDKRYLTYLAEGLRRRGVDVLLFTSDGPSDWMMQGGTLPDVFKTANFGSRAEEAFRVLRQYQPEGPLMCMEYWNGWFDHWGEPHHTREPQDAAASLDEILQQGASVNIYMFHGGTNFGFMSGANLDIWSGQYQPTVTSYDYDSPLDEAGDPTPKYYAFREVLGKYTELPDIDIEPSPKQALGTVELTERASLFSSLDRLSRPVWSATPEPMEYFDQQHGFILYRTQLAGPLVENVLSIRGLHDRALVFVNGTSLGVLERSPETQTLPLAVGPEGVTLDILVENMGRVNYGPDLLDRKGITGHVMLGQQFLYDWTIYPLPLEKLDGLDFTPAASEGQNEPTFYRATFEVQEQKDTFLALPGWTKGVCWLNGRNLGRYWERGPQKTLYVPGPFLKPGLNELIVFELHGTKQPEVEFRAQADLGE